MGSKKPAKKKKKKKKKWAQGLTRAELVVVLSVIRALIDDALGQAR